MLINGVVHKAKLYVPCVDLSGTGPSGNDLAVCHWPFGLALALVTFFCLKILQVCMQLSVKLLKSSVFVKCHLCL